MGGEQKKIGEHSSTVRVTVTTPMGGKGTARAIRKQELAGDEKGEKKEIPKNDDSAYWNSKSKWAGEDGRHSPEAAKEAWASTRQKGIMEDLGVSAREARERDTEGK